MLRLLHIENIAVVERADMEFEPGLSVLTGETGAGKSIVIDAIGAILGGRTSRDLIRTGAASAEVSALFDGLAPPVTAWLAENGYEADEDGLLVRRQIAADGKNSCKIGGRPATVALLRELGARLVDIHGQHESGALLSDENHLPFLDAFAELASGRSAYRRHYDRLREAEACLSRLAADDGDKAARTELLGHQIDELESAAVVPGETEQLEARRRVLSEAENIASALDAAFSALYGDEESAGACDLASAAAAELESVAPVDEALQALSSCVSDLAIRLGDAATELRDMRGAYDFSPEAMDEIEGRLELLQRLKRKYRCASEEELLAELERLRTELDEIAFSEEALEKAEAERLAALSEALACARKLSEARKKAAAALARRMAQELFELDMKKARFEAVFDESLPEAERLGRTGFDRVSFYLSANLGEDMRPLSKTASGGELARIMLAMKNILAESDAAGTVIFDEVDAGVSGHAAQAVAEKLARVSERRQVLCVTHLPQIAAMADTHYRVEKGEAGGRTVTEVTTLTHEGRVSEIARIIGGAAVTGTTLMHADELIRSALDYKTASGAPAAEN